MNAEQRLLVVGIYINSALYQSGCFLAGFITGNGIAWRCALACAGVSYIAYTLQVLRASRRVQATFVAISVGLGIIAGLALLFG